MRSMPEGRTILLLRSGWLGEELQTCELQGHLAEAPGIFPARCAESGIQQNSQAPKMESNKTYLSMMKDIQYNR